MSAAGAVGAAYVLVQKRKHAIASEVPNTVAIHGFVTLGFADPETQIGYAYVPNRKGTTMGGDPRDVALRTALFSATPAARN